MTTEAGSDSVAFDRAAGFYDATRILPPETHRAMCDAMFAELRGNEPCLEIGVGTGRVALPLAEAGLDIVGIDISTPMVAKLVEKTGSKRPLSIAMADATALPFGDDSFGGAYGVHVLHLIGEWRHAVRELARVVRPRGVIVFDIGNADRRRQAHWQGPALEIEERFLREAGVTQRWPGITDTAELDAVLEEFGGRGRDLERIHGTLDAAPGVIIGLLEQGVFSCAWDVDPETRRRAAETVRTWFRENHGDPDTPRALEIVVALRAYDLPS